MLARLQQLAPCVEDIIVIDTEFIAEPGHLQVPVCLAARELRSGKLHRIFFPPPGNGYPTCPFPLDTSRVFVTFVASAEYSTFLRLGWGLPALGIDLHVEWLQANNEESRRHTMKKKHGNSLLAACLLSGLPVRPQSEKDAMRALVLRGFPYSEAEQQQILDYCQEDVTDTEALLGALGPRIRIPQAAIRNARYMKAVSHIETTGIPLDTEVLGRLQCHWTEIKRHLIDRVDEQYHIYENGSLKFARLEAYLTAQGIIDFPRTPTGQLCISKEKVSEVAKRYPQLQAWATLQDTLGQTRLGIGFAVGADGRCRAPQWPFATVTGRNQPSNKQFVFAASAWLRHLVKPAPGRALVYLDWACQEFFCAAYISGDKQMQEVLRSSDPYLGLAKMAGAAPAEATKRSHPELRRQFKALALAVMYGKGAYTLGRDLRISAGAAQDLLDKHKQLFARFWQWQDGMLSDALINYSMVTKLGWERKILPVSARSNGNRKDLLKSLANHPMQSTGAEMMRLASCYSTEAELQVCASVHDGFLLESSEEDIVRDTAKMVACMNRASRELLGAEVRVEAGAPITFPNRFIPDKPEARAMWALVMEVLEALERDAANHPAPENVFSLQEAQQ